MLNISLPALLTQIRLTVARPLACKKIAMLWSLTLHSSNFLEMNLYMSRKTPLCLSQLIGSTFCGNILSQMNSYTALILNVIISSTSSTQRDFKAPYWIVHHVLHKLVAVAKLKPISLQNVIQSNFGQKKLKKILRSLNF